MVMHYIFFILLTILLKFAFSIMKISKGCHCNLSADGVICSPTRSYETSWITHTSHVKLTTFNILQQEPTKQADQEASTASDNSLSVPALAPTNGILESLSERQFCGEENQDGISSSGTLESFEFKRFSSEMFSLDLTKLEPGWEDI